MLRVLLLATTTGYQTRAFGEAASRLGVELVFATDRCHLIEDPWQDHAIPIRFHDEDASITAILESAALRPLDGLLVVGDRPTVIGARVAAELGRPWHPPHATVAARHKLLTRERLRAAGLPVPWFFPVSINHRPSTIDHQPSATSPQPFTYPCVLKPVALSGSRGVMRVDDAEGLTAALERLRRLMAQPEIRAERDEAHEIALIEGFIPGREYAVEGLMHHGALQVLAIFDKPDPLDGPFFEETLYVTPSAASQDTQHSIVEAVGRAARALGLHHGPIHAECRVPATVREPDGGRERGPEETGSGQETGVFVLEVAARPIGGLCARALRFHHSSILNQQSAISNLQSAISLEELLLRHALGEHPALFARDTMPSGVMMIPIPRRGIFRGVEGIDAARAVAGIDEIHITAKPDQLLVPLPEGASYLGFVFARASRTAAVEKALREAHARLAFAIDPDLPLLTPAQIHYNRGHG